MNIEIDMNALETLLENTVEHCRHCRSSDCGYSCMNKELLSACGIEVPAHPVEDGE